MGIDIHLRNSILDEYESSLHYSKPLIVKHGEHSVNISCAVGDDAICPTTTISVNDDPKVALSTMPDDIPPDIVSKLDCSDNAKVSGNESSQALATLEQPEMYPINSVYCFDSSFAGADGLKPLFNMLDEAADDCELYISRTNQKKKKWNFLLSEVRCNCYKVVKALKSEDFDEGCVGRKGVKKETVKVQRTANQQTVVDRMEHHKLKSSKSVVQERESRKKKSKKKQSKVQVDGVTAASNNGTDTGNSSDREEDIRNNRTGSNRANTALERCPFIVKLRTSLVNGRIYLGTDSVLTHKFHHQLPPEANTLTQSDLNDSEEAWVEQMYRMGLTNGTIAGVMTGYFNKKGTSGVFTTDTMKKITAKMKHEMDLVAGINSDITVAERMLAMLHE